MQIVFDNEEEKERLSRMVLHGIEELDMNVRDRILLLGIKNIFLFFLMECESGAVQMERDISASIKVISAPAGRGKKYSKEKK